MVNWFEQLAQKGYALLPHVLTPDEVQAARRACAAALAEVTAASSLLASAGGPAYGARNLLRLWPEVVTLVKAGTLALPLLRVLGPQGGLTRALYFDKPPGCSWALPWHRDLTIAVRQHGPPGRFCHPTRKAGVPHVQAPAELLATLLTARIHLDRVTERNGPLRVIPGSHLPERGIKAGDRDAVTLTCDAGDVLLMRPLLLHSSGHSEPDHGEHRRIVHLEFAPGPHLPDGYEWHQFISVQEAFTP